MKAPEPEYETYEYDVKPKKRLQANKSNNKVSNNPNRSNQVRANRPKPEPVVQLDEYYYDEEGLKILILKKLKINSLKNINKLNRSNNYNPGTYHHHNHKSSTKT